MKTYYFVLLLVWMVFSRFFMLGDRPFHHDESLFAFQAWSLFERGNYSHHPLLHGPLQIQIVAFFYRVATWLSVIGDGDAVSRSFSALCSVAIVFPLLGFRRWLGRVGVFVLLGLVAVSPCLWFYGRFYRNESPFLLATVLLVLSVARAWVSSYSSPWIIASFLSAAVLVALKENSLFVLFTGATFGMLLLAWEFKLYFYRLCGCKFYVFENPMEFYFLGNLWRMFRLYKYSFIIGLVVSFVFLELVYTNGFVWKQSFWGFYWDILKYWMGQHREHRLYGEFHCYLPIIALYEPFSLLVVVIAALVFFSPFRRPNFFGWMVFVFFVGLVLGRVGDSILHLPSGVFLRFFHMTSSFHLAGAFAIGWLTLCASWSFINRRFWFRAWLIWWCGLSALQYSYAGEKVPWLALHIVLPLLFLSAEILGQCAFRFNLIQVISFNSGDVLRYRMIFVFRRVCIFAFACILSVNLYQGGRLCFFQSSYAGELLIYNHTQHDLADFAHFVRSRCRSDFMPLCQGNSLWPLFYYFHGLPIRWVSDDSVSPDLRGIGFVVCDASYLKRNPVLSQNFNMREIVFRRAWVPSNLPWAWSSVSTLSDFILWRRMWGNVQLTALPLTVWVGVKK